VAPVAVRARKSKDDYTSSIYKGHPGQWSWMLHRITGVAVILFLFVHVVDTALVGWGPEAYDKVVRAYANPIVHLLELGLVIAVLYHSINGLRVTLFDFVPSLVSKAKPIGMAFTALFVLTAIPTTVIMLDQTIDLWRA
jgi:succinate dehydrogenase / fumarate reductase cytochrome b subunit